MFIFKTPTIKDFCNEKRYQDFCNEKRCQEFVTERGVEINYKVEYGSILQVSEL